MRVLLVEDDLSIARSLETALNNQGFTVDAVTTGEAALAVRYFAPRATKTGFNTDQINRMNAELGVTMDTPETVATEFMAFFKKRQAICTHRLARALFCLAE